MLAFDIRFRHVILPVMDDQGSDDDQRRDALLLRLLKTPPKPRPKRERGKGKKKATRTRGKRASAGKRERSA
jgi:hypothetical protein